MWKFKDQALCLNDEYADAWFPEEKKRNERGYVERAVYSTTVCTRCPVRAECLAWAIAWTPELQHGVLAGLTQATRAENRLGRRVNHGCRAENQDVVRRLL